MRPRTNCAKRSRREVSRRGRGREVFALEKVLGLALKDLNAIVVVFTGWLVVERECVWGVNIGAWWV